MLASLLSTVSRLGLVCLVGASVASASGLHGWAGLPPPAKSVSVPITTPIIMTSVPSMVGYCYQVPTSTTLWYMDYCAPDGSTMMRVGYTDIDCTTAYEAASTTTDQLSSPTSIFTCLQPYLSPDLPYSTWPPTGWLTTTRNWNALTQLETCSAVGTNIYWYQTEALPLATCQPRITEDISSPTAGLYTAAYCVTGGAQYGTAVYAAADTTCTSGPLRVDIEPTGCVDDATVACPSPAINFPTALPTTSRIIYDTDDCTGDALSTTYFELDTCLDSVIVSCVPTATYSTYSISYTSYTDSTNAGLCPTTTSDSKWTTELAAANTQYTTTPICLPYRTTQSIKYYCHATSAPPVATKTEKDL